MSCFCSQCGKEIDSRLDNCPYCGAINFAAEGRVPRTIDELRQFAAGQGLPLERMHMHLGEDYTGPQAYGIYRGEDGLFTVYKNKSDGSRAVRYHGPDEARAVNELYQKMLEEMTAQRDSGNARRTAPQKSAGGSPAPAPKKRKKPVIIAIIAVIAVIVLFDVGSGILGFLSAWTDEATVSADRGYYLADGVYYCYDYGVWYCYDDAADDWAPCEGDVPFTEDTCANYYIGSFEDYYAGDFDGVYDFVGLYGSNYYLTHVADDDRVYYYDNDYYYDDDYYGSDYYYSDYYDDYDDYDSYDYDYDDYDYSSWDSGGSDWDSDW